MQRYKFQALVRLGPSRGPGPTLVPDGQAQRGVVQGQHHETRDRRFFSAVVTKNIERPPWPDPDPVIMTVVLQGDDPADYFGAGDRFALWLGHDQVRGVVTRRLFV